MLFFFFFFKQKTAYEIVSRDWSSDVCSSDLIRGLASVGSEPTIMLTGPKAACDKALARAGLSYDDVDLWELNEAFASVVLHFLEETGVQPDRMNVNGEIGRASCRERV